MISVVIPVYNTEAYLKECIDSVLHQTYSDLQVILVDDGSTDGSGVVCDEYAQNDSRVIVVHQSNQGVSAARNKALEYVKGQWVSFIDSDDWLELNMYSEMLSAAQRNGFEIIACDLYDERPNKESVRNTWRTLPCNDGEVFSDDCKYLYGIGYTPVLWNKLISTDLIKNIKFSTKYAYGEDTLFLCNAAVKAKTISAVQKPLYHYRREREGNVVSAALNPKYLDLIHSYDEAADMMLKLGDEMAAGQLVYTSVMQVLVKIPPKHNNMTKPYLQELKMYTLKNKKAINTLRKNPKTNSFRRLLVSLSMISPMCSVYIWTLRAKLKK